MENFNDELVLLQASYNPNELEYFVSNKCPILKFSLNPRTSITFEIPALYPQTPAHISISSSDLTNLQKCSLEEDIRSFASDLVGTPMIMEIVNKAQESLKSYSKNPSSKSFDETEDKYSAVIYIDHMRQKQKYTKLLVAWAKELNIYGVLLFCQKWIFLILQGRKNSVKEFIIRHKTIPVDIDSTGRPCKEKMCRILFDGDLYKNFSSFTTEQFSSFQEMESYFLSNNSKEIYDILEEYLPD